MAVNLAQIQTQQERAVLRAFRDVIQSITDQAVIQEIIFALESGNVDAVITLLGLDEATFEPFVESIRTAYLQGGLTGATQIGTIPSAYGTLVARFNVRNPAAEEWLRDTSSRLVTEVAQEQVMAIRENLTAGLAEGKGPRNVALDLVGRIDPSTKQRTGGFIGLTSQQMKWTTDAERELIELDPNYLKRKLRDKRYDSMFIAAMNSGRPLTDEQITRISSALRARTLRYRAEVIARTESINALRSGQHQAIEQAIQKGNLDRRDFTKFWDATGDSRTRPDHLQMEDDYKDGIQFDQAFIAPDGSRLMYPGDTSMGASAKQTIKCRCREKIQYNAAGKLRRLEGFG
jgi:hypothetical protein